MIQFDLGQIAGSIYGVKMIPLNWINKLKHKFKIISRAHGLYNHKPYNKELMDIVYY